MRINIGEMCIQRKLILQNFHHKRLTSKIPEYDITVMFFAEASTYRPEAEQANETDTSFPFKAVLFLAQNLLKSTKPLCFSCLSIQVKM